MMRDVDMLDRLSAAALEEQLCEDMRAEPDYVPSHHGDQCGCEEAEYYPCFVCAHCLRLVPMCFGCAPDGDGVLSVYLGNCCDDCANALEAA